MPSLFQIIKEDYVTNGRDWSRPGFRALAFYRFGAWRMSVKSRLLRMPLSWFHQRLFRWARNVYGIEIPHTAVIGRRVRIEHQHGIIIHGLCVIGDECIIRQGVTLGIRNIEKPDEVPVLGQRVNVGAGAKILGKVTIGDDAAIGANAVVLCDVPAGALAVGIPAKIKLRERAQL